MRLENMQNNMIKMTLLATILVTIGIGSAFADNKNELVVGTYNIDAKVMGNHDEQRELMEKESVDIFGLQEINYNNQRFANENLDNYNPIPFFTKKNYKYSYYGNAVDFAEGGYGIATISKYPLQDESTIKLVLNDISKQYGQQFETTYRNYNPTKKDTVDALDAMWEENGIATQGVMEPRIYTRVVISKDDQKIAFYNTHLSFESTEIRKQQMEQIMVAMKNDPIKYQVLVGDFNADQSTKEWDIWRADFNITNGQDHIWYDTFVGEDDDMKVNSIDNIVVSKNIEIKKITRIISDLSDHVPLIATLELK